MKKSFSTMLVVAVAAVFLLSACGGGGDDGPVIVSEGSPGAEVPIAENTPHSGSVGANGVSFYTFTASTTNTYIIGLTNTASDLSWELWSSNYVTFYGECDNSFSAVDEICTAPITAGVTYNIVVVEWDNIAGYYTLTVVP